MTRFGQVSGGRAKKNAKPIARTIETRFPQPAIVAIAIPSTSPIAQPVRQCVVAETAARFRSCSACACKALDSLHELLALGGRLLRISRGERVRHAVVHVIVEYLEGETL